MASSAIETAASGDLIALLGVAALVVGGLALIVSGLRFGSSLLAQRVDMVQPQPLPSTDVEWKPHPSGHQLMRLPEYGISQAEHREIVRMLSRFSVSPERSYWYFAAFRILLGAMLGILAFLMVRNAAVGATHRWMLVAIPGGLALLGWLLPSIVVTIAAKRRAKAVAAGLPDALELLVVCVEAGIALEDGLDRVVQELGQSQPELARELAMTAADLKILPSRDQAFVNLAQRVDIPSVRSIVGTLSQTLRYGTPLAQSLRNVAAELRNDYLTALEEKANRLPALLTIPVMLFLMPTIFLIIGGPAALRLIDVLQRQ